MTFDSTEFTLIVGLFSIVMLIFYVASINEIYPGHKILRPIFFFLSFPFTVPLVVLVLLADGVQRLFKYLLK